VDNPPLYRSATDVAYHHLRERILAGELAGGDRVRLDDIAGALGVSRMPVRDAVHRLKSEGLLTILPRRGVIVTSLSIEDVLELFETRSVLEGLAVRCGMLFITSAEMDRLNEMVDRLEAWHGDPAQYLRLHDDFHEYLCGHSRRPRLLANIRTIREAVEPYIRLFIKLHGHEMGGTLHRPIVEAIESGDATRAEDAIRVHVVAGGTGLVEFLKTDGVVHQR
jgi:DNA-binding GntR family transcriptional regulator